MVRLVEFTATKTATTRENKTRNEWDEAKTIQPICFDHRKSLEVDVFAIAVWCDGNPCAYTNDAMNQTRRQAKKKGKTTCRHYGPNRVFRLRWALWQVCRWQPLPCSFDHPTRSLAVWPLSLFLPPCLFLFRVVIVEILNTSDFGNNWRDGKIRTSQKLVRPITS